MNKAFKNMRGEWTCKDNYDLPAGRSLRINTQKTSSGELVTSATVGKVKDGFFSYMMYQDFSRRLSAMKYPRVTCKVIEDQHAGVIDQLEDVKALVAEFYAAKETEMSIT